MTREELPDNEQDPADIVGGVSLLQGVDAPWFRGMESDGTRSVPPLVVSRSVAHPRRTALGGRADVPITRA